MQEWNSIYYTQLSITLFRTATKREGKEGRSEIMLPLFRYFLSSLSQRHLDSSEKTWWKLNTVWLSSQNSQNFLLVLSDQLSMRGFSYKKSTVYLNLILVKSDLGRSENAEVAFTGNSWRTLVPCLSFSLPRVENSAVQTGSRHIPHTARYSTLGCKNKL